MLQQRRDLEQEIKTVLPGGVRIVILDLIVLELERLARMGSSAIRTWANVSLAFLKERHYPIAERKPGPSEVDASLVAFALLESTPTAVATLDRELIRALRSLGVPTIRPRKTYGLVADGIHLKRLK